jgi:hypothetical protein
VEAAHAALSAAHGLQVSELQPADVEQLRREVQEVDPLLPFDPKHALQAASIVGNMRRAGLLAVAAEGGWSGAPGGGLGCG